MNPFLIMKFIILFEKHVIWHTIALILLLKFGWIFFFNCRPLWAYCPSMNFFIFCIKHHLTDLTVLRWDQTGVWRKFPGGKTKQKQSKCDDTCMNHLILSVFANVFTRFEIDRQEETRRNKWTFWAQHNHRTMLIIIRLDKMVEVWQWYGRIIKRALHHCFEKSFHFYPYWN